jgi:hypothetical protein
MKVPLTIDVEKPLDVVFHHFADIEFVTSVDPNTLSCKLIEGKAFTNGAVWDMVFQGLISQLKGLYTFTEYDPPRRFVVDVGIKKAPGQEITEFEPRPDGKNIKVTWTGIYEMKWFMWLIYPLMRWMVIRKGNNWLRLMKKAIETGVVPPKKK